MSLNAFQEWQSLVGSILGAISGAGAALLIIFLSRLLERREAAWIVYWQLQRYIHSLPKMETFLDANKMVHSRPHISSLFFPAAARIAVVDADLGSLLVQFEGYVEQAEKRFQELEAATRLKRETKEWQHDKKEVARLLETGKNLTEEAKDRAHEVLAILPPIFLKRGAIFRRFWRRFRMERILEARLQKDRTDPKS